MLCVITDKSIYERTLQRSVHLSGTLHLQQDPDATGAPACGWGLLHPVLHRHHLCAPGFLHHQGTPLQSSILFHSLSLTLISVLLCLFRSICIISAAFLVLLTSSYSVTLSLSLPYSASYTHCHSVFLLLLVPSAAVSFLGLPLIQTGMRSIGVP